MRCLLALSLLGGCVKVPSTFTCTASLQCSVGDVAGTCAPGPTTTSYCQVPATSCASGLKWDSSAGEGLAGTCIGSSDGGGDIGGPGGASKCDDSSFLGCWGFEEPTMSPWGYYDANGGAVDQDTTHVYRGTYAGHAHIPATAANALAAAQLSMQNVPTSGEVHMRAFVYMPTLPPWPQPIVAHVQNVSPYQGHSVLVDPNGVYMLDGIFGTTSSHVSFPTNEWVCVEMSEMLSTAGSIRVSINDVDVPALATSGNGVVTPPTNELVAALYVAGTNALPAYEFWIDEVAVDTKAIGCDR